MLVAELLDYPCCISLCTGVRVRVLDVRVWPLQRQSPNSQPAKDPRALSALCGADIRTFVARRRLEMQLLCEPFCKYLQVRQVVNICGEETSSAVPVSLELTSEAKLPGR